MAVLSPARIKEVKRELFSLSNTKDELSSALASLVFERGATSTVIESKESFIRLLLSFFLFFFSFLSLD